ncbi:MAG: response regulator [Calditrichaeota bacterium]|nr:MAG: response regulator [Calditrichota bacterium]
MNTSLRALLLVEPDKAPLLREALSAGRYSPIFREVAGPDQALQALSTEEWEVLFLEHAPPAYDALSTVSAIREFHRDVPVIVLAPAPTGREAATVLAAGANDYVGFDEMEKLLPVVQREVRAYTERLALKQIQERVTEQAEWLNRVQDAIVVIDGEGTILYWNRSAERIYGWKSAEARGQHLEDLFQETAGQLREIREIALQAGQWEGEFRQRRRDGKELIVEARFTLLRTYSPQPQHLLIVATDITDKKRLEAQFLRAQRMENIRMLAAGIAHDLNNILSPILIAVQMMQMDPEEPPSPKVLETIEKSALRGAELVKQVLAFAQGDQEKQTLVHPRYLLQEVVGVIRETFPRSIDIKLQIPERLFRISGDPMQLTQVLFNLCINARDAMPEGGVLTLAAENLRLDEPDIRLHPDARPGDYVVFTVADTGTGIPPEKLEHIFEPFYTTKEGDEGTGLGLPTVEAIVRNHNGFVTVFSQEGKGSAFKVFLPVARTEGTTPPKPPRAELPTGQGELILVVDDEAFIRNVTKQTLESFGYTVITAANGAQAVEMYRQRGEEIRAVLLDMMMPIMDGARTIAAIREIQPRAKIIATSGLIIEERGKEAEALGVEAFLPKPYTAEMLVTTVHRVVNAPEA